MRSNEQKQDPPSLVPIALGVPYRFGRRGGVELWMQKRREKGPLDGLLEFPGGKIEPQEGPESAVCRELEEECSIKSLDPKKVSLLKMESFHYPDRSLIFYIHLVEGKELELKGGQWYFFDWTSWKESFKDKLPQANDSIVEQVLSFLKREREEVAL